jgi:hypothetical protein
MTLQRDTPKALYLMTALAAAAWLIARLVGGA